MSRRRFVAGGAAALGVAVLGGGLFSRLSAGATDTQPGSSAAPAASRSTTQSGSGTTTQSGGGTAQSSGSASSSGGSSSSGSAVPSGSTTAVLVSVDASACIGCGRCLNVCPAGVFAWDSSGSHAVARNASRCIRCHRCLQSCPASAITVNG